MVSCGLIQQHLRIGVLGENLFSSHDHKLAAAASVISSLCNIQHKNKREAIPCTYLFLSGRKPRNPMTYLLFCPISRKWITCSPVNIHWQRRMNFKSWLWAVMVYALDLNEGPILPKCSIAKYLDKRKSELHREARWKKWPCYIWKNNNVNKKTQTTCWPQYLFDIK